jgi:phenylacetate-CoA ligase
MKNFHIYKDLEFSSVRKINSTQNMLFKKHLEYCLNNSPYYRKFFKKIKINKAKFDLTHLSELPFTDKTDIENYNEELLAVKPEAVVDIVLSSGTTGKPTKIAYTESDLKRLAYNEEQSFLGCGLDSKDKVLLTCTMDRCFVAGLAYFLGVRALGGTTIRNGLNSLESHLEVIKRMVPTAIIGVPSFIRKLGQYLDAQGYPARKSGVSKIICIGEPLRDRNLGFLKVGEDLERIWKAKVYSTYSSSEIVSTFCECHVQKGGHLHPDLAIAEIIDERGNVLPYGETGELVVTPLGIEGMPLIRFKTGDISLLIDKKCACGRSSLRLGPILGRKKQMMKVSGTTLYPQAIYSCLDEIGGISEYYISVTSDDALSDNIEVYAAVRDAGCSEEVIQEKLQARLRVRPKVFITEEDLVREQVYSPKSRKPVRFIDRR